VIITSPRAAPPPGLPPRLGDGCRGVRAIEPEERSICRSQAEAIQLENVVRRAHQRPFPLHLLESTQQELPEAAGLLDLSNHRFHDPFAGGVDRGALFGEQLAGHPIDDRGGRRQGRTRLVGSGLRLLRFSIVDAPVNLGYSNPGIATIAGLTPVFGFHAKFSNLRSATNMSLGMIYFLFFSSGIIGSHSSSLLPSGSMICANFPFSCDSGPDTISTPFCFS
jgi:hypothetical protein